MGRKKPPTPETATASISRVELWPEDAREYAHEQGLTDEAITRAGIRYVGVIEAQKVMRNPKAGAGLLIPNLDFDTGAPTGQFILRPIPHRAGLKYINQKGVRYLVYWASIFVPGSTWQRVAHEPAIPIYIVESWIKALRLAMENRCVVAGNGIGGLGGKTNGLREDLSKIEWGERRVIYVPDSDYERNADVKRSVYTIGTLLKESGADVVIRLLSTLAGHEKTDPNNYLNHPDGGIARFDAIEDVPLADPMIQAWKMPEEVARLNVRHAIVRIRGSVGYLVEPKDKSEPPDFLKRADFLGLYEGNRVVVGHKENGAPIIKTEAQIWLESEHHRIYEGITLDPGPDAPKDKYNLWAGWAFEPEPGHSWKLFEDHIRTVFCNDDPDLAEWFLNWLAARVQQPERKAGVAVVAMGVEDIGKSFTGHHFGKLYGRHCIEVTSDDDLLGTFNSHLSQGCLILAEEALFAGNRKHANMLKNFLSSETLRINTKFLSNYTIKNRVALMMTSNEDLVVAAGPNARRFTVFDVNKKWENNPGHFDRIRQQLEAGGYATMMYDLLRRDITVGPDPWKYHPTKALYRQKRLVESLAQKFIFNCLVEEKIGDEKWGRVSREQMLFHLSSFLDFMKADKHEWQSMDMRLGIALQKFVGPVSSIRGKTGADGKRSRLYVLSTLADSRRRFEQATRTEYDWETGEPK
jgi:hypothetical protein